MARYLDAEYHIGFFFIILFNFLTFVGLPNSIPKIPLISPVCKPPAPARI